MALLRIVHSARFIVQVPRIAVLCQLADTVISDCATLVLSLALLQAAHDLAGSFHERHLPYGFRVGLAGPILISAK